MPIQGDNYVAPKWKNDQSPAINAQELGDISNTLANDWRRDQVLTPNTAQVFGLDADATPDQVFSQIAQQFGKTVNVTVTLDGSPISGVTVDGITTKDGGVCITNSSGIASGYCGTNSTKLTAKSIWLDVDDVSKTVDTSLVETNTSIAMTSKSNGTVRIDNSKTVRFTNKRTSIQYYLIGGGAGGGLYVGTNSKVVIGGSGGGGWGDGTLQYTGGDIEVVVGSGGKGITTLEEDMIEGSSGGATIITYNEDRYRTSSTGRPGEMLAPASSERGDGPGGNGGSGGGYAYVASRSTSEAIGENGGQDGSDGEGRDPGTGCGTSTTVDGIKYCSGAGGLAYNKNADSEGIGQPGYGAGAGVITTNISVTNTAHDGTLPGAAGGNVIVSGRLSGSNNVSFKSSSGADGIVIFKWTA